MSQELQLGKYEFYPYELDKSKTPTLEELKTLLRKARADKKRTPSQPSTAGAKRRPRGK